MPFLAAFWDFEQASGEGRFAGNVLRIPPVNRTLASVYASPGRHETETYALDTVSFDEKSNSADSFVNVLNCCANLLPKVCFAKI